jgi:hypothetical protein
VTPQQADALIDAVRVWLECRNDLRALALAGSWARGNPKPSSDLDLIIVASDPEEYQSPDEWLCDIPLATAAFEIDRYATRMYGCVWSCHVFLKPDAQVELTFAAPAWANIDPSDPGTKSVVADAFRIIVDKDGALQRLFAMVQASGATKD